MKVRPIRQEGYELLHHGMIELSYIETNGIRINPDRLDLTLDNLQQKIRSLREEVRETNEWKTWRRRFGDKANLTSRAQLANVLHVELEYEVVNTTETGQAATDAEALARIGTPFTQKLAQILKYEKAVGTFLKGIKKEAVGEFFYPVFNLHTAQTYRSSSENPNFQNLPVRDKEVSEIVRSIIVPRPNSVIVENDFRAIEVSISACYHRDKNFISYITTPGKDMHRDMAAQIYMLPPEDVSKDARYGAKNKFVFPQFYGSMWINCAPQLWDWIEKGQLKNKAKSDDKNAISLFDHLKSKGIKRLGTASFEETPSKDSFQRHVKNVEDDFWNNRFRGYGRWKREWYRQYLKKGYFDLFTGFRIEGAYDKRSVCNYPIQGSAFHCLLWALIRINRALRKYKMKSVLLGQIHDSLIGDIRTNELRDYLDIVQDVVTVQMRKAYRRWLEVPLEIEYEICPEETSWYQKREVFFKDGKFKHPTKDIWTSDARKFLKVFNKVNR